MFSACGPERRSSPMRSSSRATRSVSRSRNDSASSSPAWRAHEHVAQRRLRDRAAAEAGDDGRAVQLDAGQRHPHVRADDAADADGERLLEHDDLPRVLQRVADRVERERAERRDAERADRDALLAQLVDGLLDRAEHRAERDDDRLGALGPVGPHEPSGAAAERRLEVRGDLGDPVEREHLLVVLERLDLHERLGTDHRADRHRVVRVEHLARLERRQPRVHLLLRRACPPPRRRA